MNNEERKSKRENMMRKILLLMVFVAGMVGAQSSDPVLNVLMRHRQKTVLYNGGSPYYQNTSPSGLNFSGAQKITVQDDIDFEVTKGNWADNGNHSLTRSTVNHYEGVASGLLVASGVGDAISNYESLPIADFTGFEVGKKYSVTAMARGITGIPVTDILAGWDFTSIWTAASSTVIIDATNFSVTNTSSGLFRNGTLTAGKRYKITIAGSITASRTLSVKAGSSGGAITGLTGLTTSFSASAYYDATGTSGNGLGIFLSPSNSCTVTITTLKVETVFSSVTINVGTKSQITADVNCSAGFFSPIALNFVATAGEVNQVAKVFSNVADSIYLDKIRISQKSDFIISTSVKSPQTGSRPIVFFGSSDLERILITISAGLPSAAIVSTGRAVGISGASTINDNIIQHSLIAVINSAGNMTFYVDGVSIGTYSITSIGDITATLLYIGRNVAGNFLNNGTVGETSIWKFDALPSDDGANIVADIYNRFKLKKSNTNYPGGEVVLDIDWANSGRDKSSYGNHLTKVNASSIIMVK